MARSETSSRAASPFWRWFLEGHLEQAEGAFRNDSTAHAQHAWWKVMCLTGVDYFSTLGYQPGIAALAAGALSPIATLILVLLTLFGALPIYRRVAKESPHGEGSLAMLEHLLPSWSGKLFVLCLLGFVATDFIITITLSAADATAHIVENPFAPAVLHHATVPLTLAMVALLAGIFLRGFKEAIGIAVLLVAMYLALNAAVVAVALAHVIQNPHLVADWQASLFRQHGSPLAMIGVSLILFPKLALGLSGFETGVAVMPLIEGSKDDDSERPRGRIRNTHRLLVTAAVIMSVFLLTSSFVTTALIPHELFVPGGPANGRALAYLAHQQMGAAFGTVYDISTILILWFAGASAMAGLLNIVPRYLPRYGMAPNWAHAVRPLVVVFTTIAFAVTILFRADVDAQGGAYATGVLVLMTSAAVAVTITVWRSGRRGGAVAFGVIAAVFAYTTVVNIIERPDGVKIASFFIGLIILTSLLSRIWRSTELRVLRFEYDENALRFLDELSTGEMRLIAHKRETGDVNEYRNKRQQQCEGHNISSDAPIVFLEVDVGDASEFADVLVIKGLEVEENRIVRATGSVVPNAIAAILLDVRDRFHQRPHCYFSWSEGNPFLFLLRYIAFGEGDTAPVTHEVLRQAEPDPDQRPFIHVGGS